MARLKIFLLGSFQATLAAKPLLDFESDKGRALLAYLAVESGRPYRREKLAGLLWSDTPERAARTNLRSALANLRQVIQDHQAQPPFLTITRQTIQLNQSSDFWLDVAALQSAIVDDRHRQDSDDAGDPSTWVDPLQNAVSLYQGQFMAGFHVRNAPLFEEWALIMRESLQRSALQAMHRLTAHYQNIGSYDQAAGLAQQQIELEPFQEAAHQQLMWSLALNGQRNEALLHYDRFESLLDNELGVAPLDQTQKMVELLREGDLPDSPATNIVLRREPRSVGACPYRGLAPFRDADAAFFYGRNSFTSQLAAAIEQQTSVAVILGSSGSGKSSAVFAGLLPRLRDEGQWLAIDFRPGSSPFQAMAAAFSPHLTAGTDEAHGRLEGQDLHEALCEGELPLLDTVQKALQQQPAAGRLLLVIDQFEELYTLGADVTLRHRFLDWLLQGTRTEGYQQSQSSLVLLLTLRADFMGQALAYRPFADLLNQRSYILGPMNQEELRSAIESPAQQQSAIFEPGLVTRILDDLGEEPGSLPLLQFALTLLWERLDQGWLTHAAYEEIGKTSGALARYAEDVFLALYKDIQNDAQHIFVQLVQPGMGTEDSRRIAYRREFGDGRWQLIKYLAGKRLVVTGRDATGSETVELVHEALIREWDRLRDWVETNREFRAWQEQLRAALQQWEESSGDEGALLAGVPLSKSENWLIERNHDLSDVERQFIQASLRQQREHQETEIARQARESSLERRSRRYLQGLVVVLAVATLVSLGLAFVARNEARQAIEASSLSLAATAQQALNEKDYTSALALAMAANRIEKPPPQSQQTLLEAAYSPGPRQLHALNDIFDSVQGPPLSIAISPDGQSAFTGLADGQIVMWDISTGLEIRRFAGILPSKNDPNAAVTSHAVNDLAISADGQLMASGAGDGLLILWDVGTGAEIRRIEGHSGAVRSLAFTPDNRSLISGGLSGSSLREPGQLIQWDLQSGQEIRRFEGFAEAVIDIAISADGRQLIAATGEADYLTMPGQVYNQIAWDIVTGDIIHQIEGLERHITTLAFSPPCAGPSVSATAFCDNYVLTGSSDHNLYLWNLETDEQVQSYTGHTDIVRAVAFSPDGRRALSGSDDGELILWDLAQGELLARFRAHTLGINDIAFNPDGRTAVTAARDDSIALFDLSNASQLNRLDGHEAAVLDIAYMPDGQQAVSASGLSDPASLVIEEDSLRLWNLTSGQQTGTLNWHLNDIFQIAVSPDGRRVLSGLMLDSSIRMWDTATGQEIRRFEGHTLSALSVAFTPDGRKGLSGAVDSQIILWDLETGAIIHHLTGHEGGIWSLAVSPDGSTALSGADDRLLIWWDIETGKEIQRFAGHTETVTGVAFSPDGRRAISGDSEGFLIEWDLDSGQEIQRISAHSGTGPVGRTRVAYRPDVVENPEGWTALSSGWDGTLALWNLQTGKELHRFSGHDEDFIFDIAISPDGRTALSSGTDQTIIHWQLDIPTPEELLAWITANRYVRELSCSERTLYQIEPLCPPQS